MTKPTKRGLKRKPAKADYKFFTKVFDCKEFVDNLEQRVAALEKKLEAHTRRGHY